MKICVAGYGLIGEEWVRHYRADAFEVAVWNRTPRPDAPGFVPDLDQALAGAGVLHIVVADPPAVDAVLGLAAARLKEGLLVIQSSTISPTAARSFEQRCRDGGAAYVEAPFTGSKPAARDRQNVFYLGGEPSSREQARRILHGLSRKMFDIGTVAQAAALKLAMNVQIAGIAQALAESLTLARAAGVSDEQFFDVLEANVARSGVSALKKDKLIQRDYTPQFSTKHMAKDLGLVLAATTAGTLPLTTALADVYAQGLAAGWGDDDFSGLIRLLESGGDSAKKRPQGP